MRNLTEAEIRVLKAIPADTVLWNGKVLRGTLRPSQIPKGISCATVRNLWKHGLLKLGRCMAEELPCSLTAKGKAALNLVSAGEGRPCEEIGLAEDYSCPPSNSPAKNAPTTNPMAPALA